MGDVINLRLVRKKWARDEASSTADRNRRLFGRTTAQKAADAAAKIRIERTLDGARRDNSTTETSEE